MKEGEPIIFFPFAARQRNPFYLLHPPTHIANKIGSIVEALEEKKNLALGLTAVAVTAGVVVYQEIKKRKGPYDFYIPAFSVEELEKFREMVEINWDLIYFYALFRLTDEKDAEDITSQTFIRAAGKFNHFIPLEGLKNPYSPWLYKIVANQISNFRRKKKWEFTESEIGEHFEQPGADSTLFIDKSLNPEDILIAKQTAEHQAHTLQAALDKLPYRYQLVLYLKSHTPLTDKEIAVALGISKEAIKSLIHRARKALEKIYKD